MKIGILQPGYLPWLGFFEQLYKSDCFVIYDDVQYDKGGWRNRNRIKCQNGALWLTVPVIVDFQKHLQVREVKIDNATDWRKKHLLSIAQNYSKSVFFKKYIDVFEEAFAREWNYLVDLDLYFIHRLKDLLGMSEKKIVRSSELNIQGDRIQRLIDICKALNADTFYEGAAGRDYLDQNYFLEQGIKLEFQDYKHPVYNQLYGKFIPYLSVIDLLFNYGDESLLVLTGKAN